MQRAVYAHHSPASLIGNDYIDIRLQKRHSLQHVTHQADRDFLHFHGGVEQTDRVALQRIFAVLRTIVKAMILIVIFGLIERQHNNKSMRIKTKITSNKIGEGRIRIRQFRIGYVDRSLVSSASPWRCIGRSCDYLNSR